MRQINYLENKKNLKIKRVILFGVDGFGSYAFEKDKTLFQEILENSQYTLKCRADYPTVSCPNWNTILTGTSAASHGYIRWNSPYPEIKPSIENEYERFPSIFYNIKKTDENLKTAAFFTWTSLSDILEPDVIDKRVKNYTLIKDGGTYEEKDKAGVINAMKYFIEKKPNFMFLHNDDLDHNGHANTFESKEYVNAAKKVEKNFTFVLEQLKKNNLEDETLVILASDHGGFYRDHSMVKNMAYREGMSKKNIRLMTYNSAVVPLIFVNPNLKNKGEIKGVVNNWDIAPTISGILGIKFPIDAIGRGIHEVKI